VPVVTVPRSFVVREADVVPSRTGPRRTLFAMQWATAVVALLFVVVMFGDALTGGWMKAGSWQAAPEAMLAEPVAMEQVEQEVAEAPKALAVEQGTAITTTVVVEAEVVAEKEMATEKDSVTEKQVETKKEVEGEQAVTPETGEGVVGATPSDDEKVRAFALDQEAGAAKVGATNGVTTTITPMPPSSAEVATLPAEPTPMAAPPTPVPGEPDVVSRQAEQPLPETAAVQPPKPVFGGSGGSARVAWRIVEIGLGVALIGLIVAIVLVRRRI
jgi:hypothetical protein